jgi:hypothetical protein
MIINLLIKILKMSSKIERSASVHWKMFGLELCEYRDGSYTQLYWGSKELL